MNKIFIFLFGILTTAGSVLAQQLPLSENYFMDKYSLSPSYAGNFNSGYLVTGYRSDWSGIEGGPKTLRISYNDAFSKFENAGYGGKIIYDKAGIFNQLFVMGSYSYNLEINREHHLLFGLSGGVYRNSINLLDYYNDPNYKLDPSLVNKDVNSKLKFMSDVSAIWIFKGLEAGVMVSNISFGDASYKDIDLKYNPLANYQFHATYLYEFSKDWSVSPLLIVRGGQYIKSQIEFAAQATYLERIWGSLVFRDPGIFGIGLGANIDKGLKIAYHFNLASNVALGAFNNHEISLGVNISNYLSKTR
ncbi:MAG: PorP/SprF family type IX secretion system membrane protein [Bacteroidales bacterium]|nr:PorP/SprF family type IX secretion system membrane protein [Bacteroidales bacterium]MCB9012654.1 PorP/SprF family type IX secretion system membrane protein [Bacteroidales bacterium]